MNSSCIVHQEEDIQLAVDSLTNDVLNKECLLNYEYKSGGLDAVTLLYADTKDDIAQNMITEGLVLVEYRREKRLNKLMTTYKKAEEKAKADRVSECLMEISWSLHLIRSIVQPTFNANSFNKLSVTS